MNIRLPVAFSALFLSSTWAWADDEPFHVHPSYSYFETSFLEYNMDVGGVGAEPHGSKLELSVELGDSLYALASRNNTRGTRGGSDFDFDTEGYGFGIRGRRWFASYTFNTWDMDGNDSDVETLRIGLRRHLADRLEFNASYAWNTIEDAANDDGFQVGFVFSATENLHLTTSYETIGGDHDLDYLSAGVRLTF